MMMDFTHISFLTGLGCGICVGLSLYTLHRYFRKSEKSDLTVYAPDSKYRIILVVRTDLNMGKGKIAAQCGHACVGAIEKAQKKDKVGLEIYKKSGQTKIAYRIDSEKGIIDLANHAKRMGLITSLIRDAGRTQIAANSVTVLAIGPAPNNIIDNVAGHLKLL